MIRARHELFTVSIFLQTWRFFICLLTFNFSYLFAFNATIQYFFYPSEKPFGKLAYLTDRNSIKFKTQVI